MNTTTGKFKRSLVTNSIVSHFPPPTGFILDKSLLENRRRFKTFHNPTFLVVC